MVRKPMPRPPKMISKKLLTRSKLRPIRPPLLPRKPLVKEERLLLLLMALLQLPSPRLMPLLLRLMLLVIKLPIKPPKPTLQVLKPMLRVKPLLNPVMMPRPLLEMPRELLVKLKVPPPKQSEKGIINEIQK